jgi:Eukaryotic initiation factor 4E
MKRVENGLFDSPKVCHANKYTFLDGLYNLVCSSTKIISFFLRISGLASRYFEEILLALIGNQVPGVTPDEICGVVISIRYSEDILGIWNKTADREVIGLLRDAIKKVLQLPPQASMEYKPHQTSIQDKSSFRNTQVWKPKAAEGRERSDSRTSETHPRRSSGSAWSERDERKKTSAGSGGGGGRESEKRSWR